MARSCRAVLALTGVLFVTAGCGNITQSVSPHYPEMIAAVPFKADRPIAREIKYVYFSVSEVNEKRGRPLMATNYVQSPEGSPGTGTAGLPPAVAEGALSDQYSEQAREAMNKGDHLKAEIYSGLAVSSLETEMAMANMVNNVHTVFNVYFSAMDTFALLAQHWQDEGGQNLHDWTVESTGAIGDAAPPGSVLHLSIMDVAKIRRFDLDSRWDFVVTATLVDGRGRTVSTAQGVEIYTHSGDDTKPPPGFVPMIKYVPAEDRRFDTVRNTGWGFLSATLINAAVADIYAKLGAEG